VEVPAAKDWDQLCLSDYVLPAREGSGSCGVFVVTAGDGVRERAEKASTTGIISSHMDCRRWRLKRRKAARSGCTGGSARIGDSRSGGDDHGAAVYVAISREAVQLWVSGLPGIGIPGGIWSLLRPEEIGVQLTEGFMMDPEASVSALVFQHPDCSYFSVGESE